MYFLLIMVPITVVFDFIHVDHLTLFAVSIIALLPLAKIIIVTYSLVTSLTILLFDKLLLKMFTLIALNFVVFITVWALKDNINAYFPLSDIMY